jgi:hypothetical protein
MARSEDWWEEGTVHIRWELVEQGTIQDLDLTLQITVVQVVLGSLPGHALACFEKKWREFKWNDSL